MKPAPSAPLFCVKTLLRVDIRPLVSNYILTKKEQAAEPVALKQKTAALITAAAIILITSGAFAAPPLYVEDTPYLQKRAVKYGSKDGLPVGAAYSVAVCGGAVYAGMRDGVYILSGEKWSRAATAGQVSQLICDENKPYAATHDGFFALTAGGPGNAKRLYEGAVAGAARVHGGFLLARGAEAGIVLLPENGGPPEAIPAFNEIPVHTLAADTKGAVWAATNKGISSFKDGKLTNYAPEIESHSRPEGNYARSIFADSDGKVYFATSEGIRIYDRGDWSTLRGKPDGLPMEDVRAVAVRGDTLAAGFSVGAARRKAGEWEYLQSGRWLTGDSVRAVAIGDDGSLWFGTDDGVSKIEYTPMTLAEKAAYFQKYVRMFMRHGFTGDAHLMTPGDLSSLKKRAHDNENVWTGMQLASECFRYGVTRAPDALENAKESLAGMLFLETVTGIPGFFARSYADTVEDLGNVGEWHDTPDGKWRWKGDTSSDEAVGRFFGFSVYYDLCADDAEKKQIAGSISRTTHRIIDDDYYIIDTDGRPTLWGRWNPKYLASTGRFQRDLNSLEILMMLKTAGRMTGEKRFASEYEKLIRKHGYARNSVNAKIKDPRMQNHSDDLLAFLSYYPLLKYEKDPVLLNDYYRKSIRRTWGLVREKRNPLWNYIYGASMPGEDFDAEGAAWFLRRAPLDLVYWGVRNSQRADIEIDPGRGGRPGELQAKKPLPPDESFMLKFNENPYRLDGFWNGTNSETPSYWLLPYWMGRYHGFIR